MPRRRELAAVTLAFILTLPALTTRFYASDEIQFFAWLHSWVFDHDVDFDNEYRHFYDNGTVRTDGFRQTFLVEVNEAGRRFNFAPIGSALLWLPFYGAGHVAAGLTGAPQDGYSRPYIAAVALGSAFYGACALVLSLALARRLTGSGEAATLWVLAGTPLAFYMYIAPGFSHACSAFAVALCLWVWLRARETWSPRGAALLGVTGALMAMVREQDAFFLAGPAIDFAAHAWRTRRAGTLAPTLRAALSGSLACLATYAPQLAAYRALNGHPSQTEAVARKMSWTSPHFFEVLVSPEHGFFLWTPLAGLSLAGLILLAVRVPVIPRVPAVPVVPVVPAVPVVHAVPVVPALLFLLLFLLQCYVSGAVESWKVAGSFGQRRFIGTTPLLVLGLAVLQQVTTAPVPRWTRRVVLALCVWWQLGLMAQFGLHAMDRQRLTLPANARWTFVTFPRQLPSLAWRYVFDRASFYGARRD
jgi:hypothetical protein